LVAGACLQAHVTEFSVHLADCARSTAPRGQPIITQSARDAKLCPDLYSHGHDSARREQWHATVLIHSACHAAHVARHTEHGADACSDVIATVQQAA